MPGIEFPEHVDFDPTYVALCLQLRLPRPGLLRGDYYVDDRWPRAAIQGRRPRKFRTKPFSYLYRPLIRLHHNEAHEASGHIVWVPRLDQLRQMILAQGYGEMTFRELPGGTACHAFDRGGDKVGEFGITAEEACLRVYARIAQIEIPIPVHENADFDLGIG